MFEFMFIHTLFIQSSMTTLDTTNHGSNGYDGKCVKNGTPSTIISFNCHCLKSAFGTILDMMDDTDIMFLSETWVKPCDLTNIKSVLKGKNYWSLLKSSVDPEQTLEGRLFGGTGFICKRLPGITYVPIQCDNERICAIQVVSNNKVVLTVIGAYMPYYNGKSDQTSLYTETLEDIQTIIDIHDPSPRLFVGDMNAQLPQANKLARNWFKSHPFTRHSLLLYDFIHHNDF